MGRQFIFTVFPNNTQVRSEPHDSRPCSVKMAPGRGGLLFKLLISVGLIATLAVARDFKFVGNASRRQTLDQVQNDTFECIEDRQEALEVGRQCSRRCRRDAPCENVRKQCLCDGLCGMSCIKPDLNCAELPKVENGDYSPKSTRFNAKVVYHCNPGFYLFGSRERWCQGDEDWSGTPAECLSEPQCHNPVKVNHARNPSDGFYRLNDRVNYSCYPGYQVRGSAEATCKLIKSGHTGWTWADEPFRCLPKSCGDPGQIANGKRHGDSFIIASSIVYTCDDGFEMRGQARRYCQSDNQWSGQAPQCEPITCNPTDHLENGKINYAYPLSYNSTVEYACDFGFKLVGPRQRLCGPERKLLGQVPVCVEIDCGRLGPLFNGYVKGYNTRMGDKKEFVCREGMKFVGESQESVCLETGEWSHPLPKCLAPCLVPRVEHATGIYVIQPEILDANRGVGLPLDNVEPGTQAIHGSSLEVSCQKHYELEERVKNGFEAPICNNATWSYEPRCKPASCSHKPVSPRFGRIRVASSEHGAEASIYCLDGYRLRGDSATHCVKGNWTLAKATCDEIYCGHPGYIEHGSVTLAGLTGNYEYKPYIKQVSTNRQVAFECDPGYRLNDSAWTYANCVSGQWRPNGMPTCIKE